MVYMTSKEDNDLLIKEGKSKMVTIRRFEECVCHLLCVLAQSCEDKEGVIDNQCLMDYEEACIYLCNLGYLDEKNDRLYVINDKGKELLNKDF